MKTTFIYSVLIFLCSSAFAQGEKNEDKWARAAMAWDYVDQGPWDFKTSYGKASANILVKAHKELLPYPVIKNIPAAEENTYRALYSKLQNLRDNPPAWEEIVKYEEAKIITESGPPVPPVYAGNEAAKKFNSNKNDLNKQKDIKTIKK